MSRRRKRIDRIRSNRKDVSFSDLCRILDDHGFNIRGGKGSHYAAIHPETGITVTIVRRSPVKQVYVEKSLEAIEAVEFHLGK